MTTLHQRLADLTDEVPPQPVDPGLWDRGRRYQRVRRTGSLLVASVAVLVLVAIGALTWQRSGPAPRPAPAGSPVGFPDRIWTPSPWLAGTDADGPLGRVAVLVLGERGSWRGMRSGLAGISATTGDYRFLDLPDVAEESLDDAALSPDGRHVAYWLTGAPSGSPHEGDPVVGVAIYDTGTGEVRRHPIATEHGMDPEYLLWLDEAHVLFAGSQWNGGVGDSEMARSSGRAGQATLWGTGDAPAIAVDLPDFAAPVASGAGHVVVAGDRSGRYQLVGVGDDGSVNVQPFAITQETSTVPVVSDAGTRVAVVYGGSRDPHMSGKNPNSVLVGSFAAASGPGHVLDVRSLPASSRTFAVLGWVDEEHVVVSRRTGSRSASSASLFRVDTTTGESREMTRLPLGTYGRTVRVASDLLGGPTVDGVRPPTPLDPRLVTALSVTAAAGGLVGLVLWRRRVRP